MTHSWMKLAMFSDKWKAGDTGHIDTHNTIARRLNTSSVVNSGESIQAAIDALPAGGEIQLIPGIYMIQSPILLHEKIILRGAGEASVIRAGTSMPAMIQMSGGGTYAGRTLIENLTLHGDRKAQNGLEWAGTTYNRISNVVIRRCLGNGLYIHNGVWECRIEYSHFESKNGIRIDGTNITGQANAITIDGCYVENCEDAGIRLICGTNIKILNCTFQGNGNNGIEPMALRQTGGGNNLVILGNYFEANGMRNSKAGIDIDISDPASTYYGALIMGNYCYGSGTNGECAIRLERANDVTMISNRSWGHTYSVKYGTGVQRPALIGNAFNEPVV